MLDTDDYRTLAPHLESTDMALKQVVGERGRPIPHVYFPSTSVFSVLAHMENGEAVEVGTIGNEGFYGIDVLAGGEEAIETTMCQVAGTAQRMPTLEFRRLTAGDTPLRRVAQRYLLAYLSLVSQSAACNRLHVTEARFARWILMTHDRVRGDRFVLTQEFLAQMLGVHRPSVSLVANSFQQAGLIRYNRGHMTVLKRDAIEEIACECYGIVRGQFERILGAHKTS
jgi:CRP-like cAMP-binding protein